MDHNRSYSNLAKIKYYNLGTYTPPRLFRLGHSPLPPTQVNLSPPINDHKLFAVNQTYSSTATFVIPNQKTTLSLHNEDDSPITLRSKILSIGRETRTNKLPEESKNFVSNDSGCVCSPEESSQSSANECFSEGFNGHQVPKNEKRKLSNGTSFAQIEWDVPFTQDPISFLQKPVPVPRPKIESFRKVLDDTNSSGCLDCCGCSCQSIYACSCCSFERDVNKKAEKKKICGVDFPVCGSFETSCQNDCTDYYAISTVDEESNCSCCSCSIISTESEGSKYFASLFK